MKTTNVREGVKWGKEEENHRCVGVGEIKESENERVKVKTKKGEREEKSDVEEEYRVKVRAENKVEG